MTATAAFGFEPSGERCQWSDGREHREPHQAAEDVPAHRRGDEDDSPERGGNKRNEPAGTPLVDEVGARVVVTRAIRSWHGGVGVQAMSSAATVSMIAAVAQWTPNAVVFGPPLHRTIVPSATGTVATASIR